MYSQPRTLKTNYEDSESKLELANITVACTTHRRNLLFPYYIILKLQNSHMFRT